jgi:hypothetical protein
MMLQKLVEDAQNLGYDISDTIAVLEKMQVDKSNPEELEKNIKEKE